MSYLDRDYGDPDTGKGRFRRVIGRIFGDVENPLGWSLPMGMVAGIRLRLHLLFVVYAIGMLLWSIPQGNAGVIFTGLMMASLFGIVLLHEFGHCFACRAVGGEADQILMWPLGGLASCAPPENWRANLITTAGGPAVNVVLAPVTASALAFAGASDAILFNPFSPFSSMPSGGWWPVTLFCLHYVNLLILAFNVLLPMHPLDGSRIVHALIWAKSGRRRASEIISMMGMVAAGVVGVFAIVTNSTLLLAIAIFGGLLSWRERQLLRAQDDVAFAGFDSGPEFDPRADDEEPAGPSKRELKKAEQEQKEQAEVDRILAKIGASGMDSLTRTERRTLQRATKRSRGE